MVSMLALVPSVLGINYGTIRGISTPAFKVEKRPHLMWNHTTIGPLILAAVDQPKYRILGISTV